MCCIKGATNVAICGAGLALVGGAGGAAAAFTGFALGLVFGWHALAISLIVVGSVGGTACFAAGIKIEWFGVGKDSTDAIARRAGLMQHNS